MCPSVTSPAVEALSANPYCWFGRDPHWPVSWMRFTCELHVRLVASWRSDLPARARVLKTDLFEEATSDENLVSRFAAFGWRAEGIDIDRDVVEAARRRLDPDGARDDALRVADVRTIPHPDAHLDAIFSDSTLDHFQRREDIGTALDEFVRVLAPGGRLFVSLDNPSNPVLAIRNALPRAFREALGITPFYVGPTMSLRELRHALAARGLRVLDHGAFLHGPRYVAVRLLRWAARAGAGSAERYMVRAMQGLEALARAPTACWTGHFVFVHAQKPE